MEDLPQEEQQIIVSTENIEELLKSKNFKQRVLAYQNIQNFPQYLGLLQNETLAVAVESALDALLSYNGNIKNDDISGLYSQFSQTKASIRSKLSNLIDNVYSDDKMNVLCGIAQYFSHKTPKVVAGCVNKLNSLIENDLEEHRNKENMKIIAENICCKLETLFSNNDKTVRSEASTLAVTLYKIFFDDLLKYIEKINPIILKDLKETAFKKIEIPKRIIKINDSDFEHPDWKERLAAMNNLKDSIANMSNKNEVSSILFRKTKDPNLNVVIATVECVRNGKITNPDCIRGIIERFKDKKAALNALIKETIQKTLPDVNILIDMLSNKNPEIKLGIVECLKFYSTHQRIGDIGKLLEDSSAEVRKATVELLSSLDDLSDLTESQLAKIKKSGISTIKNTDSNFKNTTVEPKISDEKQTYASQNKPLKKSSLPNTSVLADNSGDQKILDYFNNKYPQLFDKDWNKRVECISERMDDLKNEGVSKIATLIINSKETNFFVLKDLMGILCTFDDLSGFKNELISYLNSKITESKLKENVVSLFIKIGCETAVKSILQNMQQSKVGKKFIASLDILTEIVNGIDENIDDFLANIKVFGMQEKKALNDFIVKYNKIKAQEKPVKKEDDVEKRESNSTQEHPKNKIKSSIMKTYLDESRQKNCLFDTVDVFTAEFLDLIQKDTFSAVEMLEKMDICAISDIIIVLYCQYNLPSPYFNSLILHLISHRYILTEREASVLAMYLLKRSMDSELDLMDRIYPATKLYKILRSSSNNEGLAAIFNLMKKYKDLSGLSVRDIETSVMQNEDFIAFSFDIDRVIHLKRELKEKLDNNMISNNYTTNNDEVIIHDLIESKNHIDPIMNERSQIKNNELSFIYQNSIQEDDNIDDLEDSIIIERLTTVDVDNENAHFGTDSPSIVYVPTIADKDSLLNECPNKQDLIISIPIIQDDSIIIPPNSENELVADDFTVPHSKIEDTNLSFEIERSLENISISTTPIKKKRNFSEMDNILSKISDDDIETSKFGFSRLIKVISDDPESIVFSSNSVIGSILIQLMNRYENLDYRTVVLNALLKFTQNVSFCSNLRYETLKSVHKDLVPLVKDNNHIADILINLCLNCDLHVLRVYFDLLEDTNDVLMKLIWRHSKKIKYISAAVTSCVMQIIDSFYEEKSVFLATADNIVIKVCLLHLKECVAAFSDNLKQFGIGNVTEEIVNILIKSKDLNIDDIRRVFRSKTNF